MDNSVSGVKCTRSPAGAGATLKTESKSPLYNYTKFLSIKWILVGLSSAVAVTSAACRRSGNFHTPLDNKLQFSAMAAAAETETPAAAVAALLTEETVPAYLSKMGVFGSSTAVTAKAIVGGNINYAFQGSIQQSRLPCPISI